MSEPGERIDPPISVVRATAKALDCKIEDLLADPGDNGASSGRH
jgi:hypothetical protein